LKKHIQTVHRSIVGPPNFPLVIRSKKVDQAKLERVDPFKPIEVGHLMDGEQQEQMPESI
jgi:hypothetical protein